MNVRPSTIQQEELEVGEISDADNNIGGYGIGMRVLRVSLFPCRDREGTNETTDRESFPLSALASESGFFRRNSRRVCYFVHKLKVGCQQLKGVWMDMICCCYYCRSGVSWTIYDLEGEEEEE